MPRPSESALLTPAVVADVGLRTHALVGEAERVAGAVVVVRALHDVQALREGVGVGHRVGRARAGERAQGVGADGAQPARPGPPALVHVCGGGGGRGGEERVKLAVILTEGQSIALDLSVLESLASTCYLFINFTDFLLLQARGGKTISKTRNITQPSAYSSKLSHLFRSSRPVHPLDSRQALEASSSFTNTSLASETSY